MDTLTGSTVPLDLEMQHLVPQILSHAWLGGSSKHLKIRIHSWLARLECIVSNNIWRKNRNNYYRILFIMLQCRQVMEPFTVMPPEDVPTLHKHQINCILTKLATRLKEKEREKENKQARTGKPDPLELWNLLEVNCTKNINTNAISSSVLSKAKTIMIDTTAKQRNLDCVAFDYLSPISEGVHARINSNLSECTYNSIERCRDLITNCNVSDQFNLGMAGEGLEDKLPAQMAKEEVKYFKKNRSKYQGEAKILPINKPQLYVKIYAFLKKHQCHLKDDLEYQEVMKELSHSLGRTQEEVATTATYEHEGGKNPECEGKQNAAQEEDFSLIEIDENSYDYLSGRYSQYSSIQVDSGLSPERIKFLDLNAEETGLKKVNGLDSYRSRGVEANPTFRRGISLHPL